MSKVIITGDVNGTGFFTLTSPNSNTSQTLTLPDNTGTVVSTGSSAVVTPAMLTQPLTLRTAVASTSGTSIDFTGIPSWAKRVTVMFNGVSTNSTSPVQLQIGSSSVTTSGYLSNLTSLANGASASVTNVTSGFVIGDAGTAAATTLAGTFVLINISGNSWICSAWVAHTNTQRLYGAQGSITLGDVLDRVRITTVSGTNTFDAGSINIMYEG